MKKWQGPSAESIIEVPFHDVDMATIAWHGHYAKYFEIARCELLESFDYNYTKMGESGYFWPIIDMRIRYVSPSKFGQKLRVNATLVEWEHRLKIKYLITDADSGVRLTKGYTCQVAVCMDSGEMLYTSPPILPQKLGIEGSD